MSSFFFLDSHELRRGAIAKVAAVCGVTKIRVSEIWRIAKDQLNKGELYANVSARRKGKCGRKAKDYSAELSRIPELPLNRRGTIRGLAHALGVPQTTLFQKLKSKEVLRVSSAVRPRLTEDNKLARLTFCLSKIKPDGFFEDMMDVVHVDEKWFYLQQTKRSYYLSPNEPAPHRTCQSKRFIPKIMFMAAVARPRYDPHRKCWFNGKIGIWPFITRERAVRNSKNRERGTIVTKPLESIGRAECTEMMLQKVFPAIRSKFPLGALGTPIRVQIDNAKPHPRPEDVEVVKAGQAEGRTIILECQPPNSPDSNILDLGFFNSIQALQHQEAPRTIDELISCVEEAFQKLDRVTLDNVFVTLQKCMECIMLDRGDNSYSLPHLGKAKLRADNRLPTQLMCSSEAIKIAKSCFE
jgi:hypothetical protein